MTVSKTLIDVAFVTWPNHPKRIAYFRDTLDALNKHLTAASYDLRFVCSSESERDPTSSWHGDELEELCRRNGIRLEYRSGPASLGANMNAALRLCSAELIFLVQDDWRLLAPLDLSDGADLLLADRSIDLIRYSYYQHPEHGTEFGAWCDGYTNKFRRVRIGGCWPYGDDPALRRQDFMAKHGWYLESPNHCLPEGDMLRRLVAARANIVAAERSYFAHVGVVAAVPTAKDDRPRAVVR